MKGNIKRIATLFLAFVLLIGLVPMFNKNANAEENKDMQAYVINFAKQDEQGRNLPGATIKISSEGKKDIEFISSGRIDAFALQEGKYVIEEIKTPLKYEKASNIYFEIAKNAETSKLEMKNLEWGTGNKKLSDGTLVMVDALKVDKLKVKFSVQDNQGKEIPGLTLNLVTDLKNNKSEFLI